MVLGNALAFINNVEVAKTVDNTAVDDGVSAGQWN
jgi:hypothetical protein